MWSMRKPNCDLDKQGFSILDFRFWITDQTSPRTIQNLKSKIQNSLVVVCLLMSGCATPEYAVRPTPTPEESASALQIERAISAGQAKEFARQGARAIGWEETLRGFEVQQIVARLSQVTERPSLHYRAFLYEDKDPNAAALADGRIYVSTGMLNYLAGRGSGRMPKH